MLDKLKELTDKALGGLQYISPLTFMKKPMA